MGTDEDTGAAEEGTNNAPLACSSGTKPKISQSIEDQEIFHDAQPSLTAAFKRIPLPLMPKFDRNDVCDWFRRLELQLALIGATTEKDKYRGLLSYLDDQLLMDTYYLALEEEKSRPVPDVYSFTKDKLIQRFRKSMREQLETLLNKRPSDDPPSVFLATLKRHSSPENAMLVREIWEDSLPESMSSVVYTMSSLPVEQVAKTMDVLYETTRRKQKKSQIEEHHVAVVEQGLAERVAALEGFLNKKEFMPREKQKKTRPSTQPSTEHASENKCYYHRKFGNKARKCDCVKNDMPSSEQ